MSIISGFQLTPPTPVAIASTTYRQPKHRVKLLKLCLLSDNPWTQRGGEGSPLSACW